MQLARDTKLFLSVAKRRRIYQADCSVIAQDSTSLVLTSVIGRRGVRCLQNGSHSFWKIARRLTDFAVIYRKSFEALLRSVGVRWLLLGRYNWTLEDEVLFDHCARSIK
jgi:hypothetical protein